MMQRHPRRSSVALLGLAVFATACSSGPGAGSPPAPAADATLEAATALGVRNATMPVPGLVVGGQLTEEQLEGLADAGFEDFISLRGPDEDGAGWEEARSSRWTISFNRLPIQGQAGLSRESAEQLGKLLEAAGPNTVLYCGSGNRAGSLLALKAFFVDGLGEEEALALGRAAGMRSLEERVKELMAGGR